VYERGGRWRGREGVSEMEFSEWYSQLLAAAEKCTAEVWWHVRRSDPQAWRGYFDDGCSPTDALNEDLGYAD
jgi:hypothetical protein